MIDLVKEVFDILTDQIEPETDSITAFNLLGALASERIYRIDEDDDVLRMLKNEFEETHEIWEYVQVAE